MTIKTLAAFIAKLEGKGSQARIGDIAEILAILSDMIQAAPDSNEVYELLAKNGERRAKRKKK